MRMPAELFCPNCGKPIQRQTIDQIVDALEALGYCTKLLILGPVAVGKKGTHKKLLEELRKEGYVQGTDRWRSRCPE